MTDFLPQDAPKERMSRRTYYLQKQLLMQQQQQKEPIHILKDPEILLEESLKSKVSQTVSAYHKGRYFASEC